MSISASIRKLAEEGLATADIAKRLGIRYQHAYGVLKGYRLRTSSNERTAGEPLASCASTAKPELNVEVLLAGGFTFSGSWKLSQHGALQPTVPLSKNVGVYAFAKDGVALYVGVATMGLAKRLYFYGRPGASQRTSQRVNALIKAELANNSVIEIYTALPSDFEWNGLPVHGSAGLELGIIKKYSLPWNMRSAK